MDGHADTAHLLATAMHIIYRYNTLYHLDSHIHTYTYQKHKYGFTV